MTEHREHHLCTTCPIPHVENCETCFGFGLTADGGLISAGDGAGDGRMPCVQCPECGGLPKWVRDAAVAWQEAGPEWDRRIEVELLAEPVAPGWAFTVEVDDPDKPITAEWLLRSLCEALPGALRMIGNHMGLQPAEVIDLASGGELKLSDLPADSLLAALGRL